MAPRTTTIAIAATRANNTTTRMLVKWSATSFSVTTPTPFKAEPSRRMALSFVDLVEVGGVDRLETRLVDRKVQEPSAGRDHRGRSFRPHVAVGHQPPAVLSRGLDRLHARHGREPLAQALPFRLDPDAEAAAENLAAELRYRSE